ncbi:MAG TPA: alpha/beta fold hydrolase [Kofleriaceae bacterium]|nr:alpha/beta fold hydrolase [Kofleriaceae bacterium]
MDPGPANPWIVRWSRQARPDPTPAALRLVCFPYGGGGAGIYRTWHKALPETVEVLAIDLPGRERRFREQPFDRLGPLVAALTDAVAPALQSPFAIYGHSLGALVGFSFARELRRRALPGPVHLFLSGRRAPQLPERSPIRHLPDPEFQARVQRLGGVPDAVARDPEVMAFFLPVLRADFTVAETATFTDEPPLACPITALGGADDERAAPAELDAWRVHTSAAFARELFPGGHFYLQSERAALLAWLSAQLVRITAS